MKIKELPSILGVIKIFDTKAGTVTASFIDSESAPPEVRDLTIVRMFPFDDILYIEV